MTDWRAVHEKVVDTFAAGWADIDSHALDVLMADNIELVQPLVPTCTSRQQWWQEVDRLRRVVTDLRSEVLSWSGAADTLFIEHQLSAGVGGRMVRVIVVDKLRITTAGAVTSRIAYFDPAPLIQAVLLSPSTWLAWWRSGLGPLVNRRKILTPTANR